jgi:hypothetical protein
MEAVSLSNAKHSRSHFPSDGHEIQLSEDGKYRLGVFHPRIKTNGLSGNKAYVKYHSFHILLVLEITRPQVSKDHNNEI